MNDKETTSSRSVGMRDINALLLSAPISRIKTLRDDEGRRGFTLIELLVVVLIIGILAAIALPQYQVSVEKTRVAQVVPTLRAIQNANELYYLTHGQYTSNKNLLDIGFDTPQGWDIIVTTRDVSAYRFYRGETYNIKLYYNHSGETKLAGKLYCVASKGNEKAAYFCQSVGKNGTKHDVNNYRFFL